MTNKKEDIIEENNSIVSNVATIATDVKGGELLDLLEGIDNNMIVRYVNMILESRKLSIQPRIVVSVTDSEGRAI